MRDLRAEEVDVRVQSATEKGCVLLLYKDARVDMNILDETYGVMGWQREHQFLNGLNYCTVSVWDTGKQMWISKQDVGIESNQDATKGEASDAFKRACFNFGIGRELYTAPFIFIPAGDCNIKDGKNGKKTCYDNFKVTRLEIKDKVIVGLDILNESNGRMVFTFPKGNSTPKTNKRSTGATEGEMAVSLEDNGDREEVVRGLLALKGKEYGAFWDWAKKKYHINHLDDLGIMDWENLCALLKK